MTDTLTRTAPASGLADDVRAVLPVLLNRRF